MRERVFIGDKFYHFEQQCGPNWFSPSSKIARHLAENRGLKPCPHCGPEDQEEQ